LVYYWIDELSEGLVVKTIRRELVSEKKFVDMFFDEARTAGAVAMETRLTDDPANSERCSAAIFGGLQGIAWSEDQDGNDEIYLHVIP
jgi:hypothetical protein